MNTDIECQVCHRIEIGDRTRCEGCGWPIRDIPMDEPVFGFDVAIEVRLGFCKTEVVEKHFATSSPTAAKNRAKRTRNFVSVLALRPLSERSYCAAYGDPRDKSKFS